MELIFVVKKPTDIKTFLAENDFSSRQISKLLLEKKDLKTNGKVYKNDFNLQINDKLSVNLKEESTNVIPKEGEIKVVYEDEYFLVVNKPKDLSVSPSKRHLTDNLSSHVADYFIKNKQSAGIHVVNRLDLLTSGLVIFAKGQYIHNLMSQTKITKKYRCLVSGIIEKDGIINEKIDRVKDSVKREVISTGKNATTKYSVDHVENGNTYLNVELFTGRTHQIRVHFSYIGHPLVDDVLYNKESKSGKDFYLRCNYLSFDFKLNNKKYTFNIEE